MSALLAQGLAAHFEGATASGSRTTLPREGLRVDCSVVDLAETGRITDAALVLQLAGGALGEIRASASVSGYGPGAENAVRSGIREWALAFGPTLRAGLGGARDEQVTELRTTISGRPYRVLMGYLDRMIALKGTENTIDAVRRAVSGSRWLTEHVLDSETLPTLPADRPVLLSVLVVLKFGKLLVEVQLNGDDWHPSTGVFFDAPHGPRDRAFVLRELAVLVPDVKRPDTKTVAAMLADQDSLQGNLDLLSDRVLPHQAAGWRGWHTHGGRAGDPLPADRLRQVENVVGTLPEDYRWFLTELAGPGAGPGYGLLAPFVSHDRVIPLAHAGCGATWVMRTDGDHRGEVWIDAEPIEGRRALVARSFSRWYTDWLLGGLRGEGPWVHWDAARCAAALQIQHRVSELPVRQRRPPVDLIGRVHRSAMLGGGAHLPHGPGSSFRLDPCHACLALYARHGLGDEVFDRGVLSGG